MEKKKTKVYFDGNCNICSKEIQFYKNIDKKKNLNGLIYIQIKMKLDY